MMKKLPESNLLYKKVQLLFAKAEELGISIVPGQYGDTFVVDESNPDSRFYLKCDDIDGNVSVPPMADWKIAYED